jgi:HPt (histidine-containing phosphotransfer) domain-containing protein
VANGDAGKLEKAAHRLKGSISIFGVGIVAQTAFELEKQGRNGDLTQTPETTVRLEQQMTSLQLTLQKFQSELQQSR